MVTTSILILRHLYYNFLQNVIYAVIKLILHLHPFSYVIKVIQVEKGVFQSCDGAVRIQQTTHVEFVTVPLVPRTRSPTGQCQRLSLEVT